MNEIEEAVRQVLAAIHVKGPVPSHHDRIMRRHRQEWPTLWQALDRLEHAARTKGDTE